MSPGDNGTRDEDGSSLDDVPEEEVEQFEEGIDTEGLDEDELVSVDDAARALLAKGPKGHGPIARLYRGETRFDFVGRRRIWFGISTLIILLGVVSIILRGGLNLGIEFKGGTEWTIAAPHVTQTQATDALKGTGLDRPHRRAARRRRQADAQRPVRHQQAAAGPAGSDQQQRREGHVQAHGEQAAELDRPHLDHDDRPADHHPDDQRARRTTASTTASTTTTLPTTPKSQADAESATRRSGRPGARPSRTRPFRR